MYLSSNLIVTGTFNHLTFPQGENMQLLLSFKLSERLPLKYLLTENIDLSHKAIKTLLCLSHEDPYYVTKLENWTKVGEGRVQGMARWGQRGNNGDNWTRSPDMLSKEL